MRKVLTSSGVRPVTIFVGTGAVVTSVCQDTQNQVTTVTSPAQEQWDILVTFFTVFFLLLYNFFMSNNLPENQYQSSLETEFVDALNLLTD